jgi:hypothetical protein
MQTFGSFERYNEKALCQFVNFWQKRELLCFPKRLVVQIYHLVILLVPKIRVSRAVVF